MWGILIIGFNLFPWGDCMVKLMATTNSIFLVLGFGFLGCSSVAVQEKIVALPLQKTSEVSKRSPANHTWNGYHWAHTTPQFTLKVGDNLTSNSWKAFLAQSSNDWNNPGLFGATSTPLITAVVAGSSGSRRCDMIAGTTQVCNAKYGNNGSSIDRWQFAQYLHGLFFKYGC